MLHTSDGSDSRAFFFKGKQLHYNQSRHNNLGERAVEVPIAFDFLATAADSGGICEIGNVLANYEQLYDPAQRYQSRQIIDKYEPGERITNIDVLDLPAEPKYTTIISISTVEHVEQEHSSEHLFLNRDLEAPLKAIAKIYELLAPDGRALITVPFGKLLDGRWYIQSSQEYLDLLSTSYGIPAEALTVTFLRRLIAPEQCWVEAEPEQLRHSEYYAPMPYANAIAVIELHKRSSDVRLSLEHAPTALPYADEIDHYTLVVAAYTRMVADGEAAVRERIAAGASLEQIVAQGMPSEWRSWLAPTIAERWLESIYHSLTSAS
jgi:hypothetical protein